MKTRCSSTSLLLAGKACEVLLMLRRLLDEAPDPHLPLREQLDHSRSLHPEAYSLRQ